MAELAETNRALMASNDEFEQQIQIQKQHDRLRLRASQQREHEAAQRTSAEIQSRAQREERLKAENLDLLRQVQRLQLRQTESASALKELGRLISTSDDNHDIASNAATRFDDEAASELLQLFQEARVKRKEREEQNSVEFESKIITLEDELQRSRYREESRQKSIAIISERSDALQRAQSESEALKAALVSFVSCGHKDRELLCNASTLELVEKLKHAVETKKNSNRLGAMSRISSLKLALCDARAQFVCAKQSETQHRAERDALHRQIIAFQSRLQQHAERTQARKRKISALHSQINALKQRIQVQDQELKVSAQSKSRELQEQKDLLQQYDREIRELKEVLSEMEIYQALWKKELMQKDETIDQLRGDINEIAECSGGDDDAVVVRVL